MSQKTAVIFNVLLNHFGFNQNEGLLSCLPQEEIEEITSYKTDISDAQELINWPNDLINKTHYCWFKPVIGRISKDLQPAIIASFPKHQSTKLLKLFPEIKELPEIASPFKKYFQDYFFQKWHPSQEFPPQFLPTTSLTPLLSLSKKQLLELIDYLALYDLAEIIRSIVDKKMLRELKNYMTTEKQQFFKKILNQNLKKISPKLSLSSWNGQSNSLDFLMHKRGLLRFSLGLAKQSKDFIWHLTHLLDTGRGHYITENYTKEQSTGMDLIVTQQILYTLNFLESKRQI